MPKVALIWRRAVNDSDLLLWSVAGELVHVDIMPLNGEDSITYTAYIGERFGMSISTKKIYNDLDYVARCIDLTPPEFERMVSVLHDLCQCNIPYNYSDLLLCALPDIVQRNFIEDIPSDSPAQITRLFCSQAMTIILRNSLDRERPLQQMLAQTNSRTMLPQTLYSIVRSYTKPCECHHLRHGTFLQIDDMPNLSFFKRK